MNSLIISVHLYTSKVVVLYYQARNAYDLQVKLLTEALLPVSIAPVGQFKERATLRIKAVVVSIAMVGVLMQAPPVLAQEDAYDCADFQYQEDAQDVYDQDTSDPYGLDGAPGESYEGQQGVACENLPSKGTSSTQTPATCDDFISVAGYRSQYDAQQYFDSVATPEDKAYLDTDGDGFACDGWGSGADTLGTQGGESGYYASDGNFYYW